VGPEAGRGRIDLGVGLVEKVGSEGTGEFMNRVKTRMGDVSREFANRFGLEILNPNQRARDMEERVDDALLWQTCAGCERELPESGHCLTCERWVHKERVSAAIEILQYVFDESNYDMFGIDDRMLRDLNSFFSKFGCRLVRPNE
jgi:hypothetical protein